MHGHGDADGGDGLSRNLDDLTVIIPVWGTYWEYIPSLVVGLGQMGVSDLVIVSPEGAPGSVAGLLDQYGCRYVSAKSASIGGRRNEGLAVTQRPYVLFADADDEVLNLDIMMDAIRHGEAVFVTGVVHALRDGEIGLYQWPVAKTYYGKREQVRQWAWNNISMTTGTVIRRDSIIGVGGWPELSLAEDWVLGCLLLEQGHGIGVDLPTRVYRIHDQGVCQRGHSAKEWRVAYKEGRRWLMTHSKSRLRGAIGVYAILHWKMARLLEHRARAR